MQTSPSVDYGYLRQLVFGLSQNVLDPSRDYLFETRLTKLLRNQGMTRLDELVQHLKANKNPALERSIAEAMTINETSFFRDSRPFELLRTELLPKLIEARRPRAACASGARPAPRGRKPIAWPCSCTSTFPLLTGWNIAHRGHRHLRRGGRARSGRLAITASR